MSTPMLPKNSGRHQSNAKLEQLNGEMTDQGDTASGRSARVHLALGHEVRCIRPQHQYAKHRGRRRMRRDVSILLEVR